MSRLLQKALSADDVRSQERTWIFDGTIDVCFRGKVHDGVDAMLIEDRGDLFGICDVGFDERVPRIGSDLFDIAKISGVGQQIQIYDADGLLGSKHIPDETRPYE